jgi:hypothetical protein
MEKLNIEKFRLSGKQKIKKKKPKASSGHFIKGPIPIDWIARANEFGKPAVLVGLVLWYISGFTKRKTVVLTSKKTKELNLSRYIKYEGLKALEKAGLIEVERRERQNPIVTILDVVKN